MDRAVRGEGVGSIQGDQKGSVQNPVVLQTVLFAKRVPHHPDEGSGLLRRDRIEDVPDLDVRRHVMHAEEGLVRRAKARQKLFNDMNTYVAENLPSSGK